MQQFRSRSCPMCKADPLRQPPAPSAAAMAMSEAAAIEMSRRSSHGLAGDHAVDGQAANGRTAVSQAAGDSQAVGDSQVDVSQAEERRTSGQRDPWLGSRNDGEMGGDRWIGLGSGDAASGDPWLASSPVAAVVELQLPSPLASVLDGRTAFAGLEVVDVGSSAAPSEQ